jgi:hypothetical protein
MVSLSVIIQKIAIENHSEYASSSTATLSEFNFATSLLSPSLSLSLPPRCLFGASNLILHGK